MSGFHTGKADVGTPFIEVDPLACRYVAEASDDELKAVFQRFTETTATASR